MIVASGLWSVRKTLRRDPQDVTGEHRWIYPGFVVQTLAFWAGVSLPSLAAALGGDGSLLSVLTVPVGLTVLLGIVAAIPTVSRYEHRHDDLRRHSMVGLILALGTLGAAGARVVPAEFELVTVTISVFCLASGSLLGIVRYFDL